MKKTDEQEWISLSLQGDSTAFEPLVAHFQGSITALCLNILGNYDDALDMVQETFVQAYVNLKRFDPERNFKTWLMAIAVKRCLDLLRKKKSFLNYFLEHSNAVHEERVRAGAHKPLQESELWLPLLKRIKGKERAALVLQMNENYSAKEIAVVLNCSESTARVHLFNARKKLKRLVKKEVIS